MSSEKIKTLMDSFGAADGFLQSKHKIKEASIYNPKWPDIYIYTDGASKGSKTSKDGRAFSGWGVYTRSVTVSGEVREFVSGGNLFNADSNEAELRAVHSALSNLRIPGRMKIISDSSYVIKGLCEIDAMIDRKNAIEAINPKDRVRWHWTELRLLNIWSEIRELLKSSKILSLEAEWVRSHTLDNEEDLPNPDSAKNDKERNLIMNCIGNFHADKMANLGAKKAVRSALWFLKNEKDEYKVQKSIETCTKNLALSGFARREAVEFLASQAPDYLPRNVLVTIFDDRTLAKIDEAHEQKQAELEQKERERKALLSTKAEQITPIPKSLVLNQNEDAIEKFKRRFGMHTSLDR